MLSFQNCIGHTNNETKTSITATWVAPSVSVGDLKIRATVVKDFSTIWTDVSAQLTPTVTDAPELGPNMLVSPGHAHAAHGPGSDD